jgi:excisionase family DNA binding protein
VEPIVTTIKGTAEALGIGRTKIYDLINAGELETVKIGTRRLVTIASIRKLVEPEQRPS